MRIFATFKGVTYLLKNDKSKNNTKLNWVNMSNDAGQDIEGDFVSNKVSFLEKNLKVGNRYLLECKNIDANKINVLTAGKSVYKNKRCDMMRKVNGTFHFIKGKFKSMKIEDIHKGELHDYMIWVAKNSKNEATIKNALEVLEIVNKIP